MTDNKEKGNIGEDYACGFLERKGYRILDRNYRSRYGEIDIIAEKGGYIAFVEVKTRQFNTPVSGKLAVDIYKQKRIASTGCLYLDEHETEGLSPRFDVITVDLSGKRVCGIRHLEGAFTTESFFGY